jgi:outer membrane protein assembly factor BamE (lipoprotein component of BamABCDE complex)
MRHKMGLVFVIVTVAFLAGGCFSMGRKVDLNRVDEIKVGKTTRQQVISMLGTPSTVMRQSGGDSTLMYSYCKTQMSAVNFIPIVGLFCGSADTQTQTVTIRVGPDGIVRDVSSMDGKM